MSIVQISTEPSKYSRINLDHSNNSAIPKLSKGAAMLLQAIKDNVCARSNVMTISINQLAKLVQADVSNVRRTIRTTLVKHDLVRSVSIYGNQHLMLNPRFKSSHATTEVWFMDALYHLGDQQEAFKFRDLCRTENLSVDPETGEILGGMNPMAKKMYHDWIDNYDNSNHVRCIDRERNAQKHEAAPDDYAMSDYMTNKDIVDSIPLCISNVNTVHTSDNLNRYYIKDGQLQLRNRYLNKHLAS
ncbi:hypothetical protein [Shewanella gaetbuli]